MSMTEVDGAAVADEHRHAVPRVMAFEMEVEGHHPGYVRNFAQCWVHHEVPGILDFVVTPKFFDLHPDAVEAVESLPRDRVSIRAISDSESQTMERVSYLRYFHAWNLFCKYLERLDASHGLVMYFDFFQLPVALGRQCPRPFSAMYFRPTFHYHELASCQLGWGQRFRGLRKKVLLQKVLRRPELKRLFCLDELAVEYMKSNLQTQTEFCHIADSFTVYPRSSEKQDAIRNDLGIEPGRRVFLLLGVLDRRKGVRELLECVPLVDDETGKRISLVLAGRVSGDQTEQVESLVRELQRESKVQVILHNQYVPDHEVQHYYDMADVILATYQGHMGSSSALIRAALAQKPVLSSGYGLMGEIVRRRRLGVDVDTTIPGAMAGAISQLSSTNLADAFDAGEAQRYADANLPAQLAADLSVLVK